LINLSTKVGDNYLEYLTKFIKALIEIYIYSLFQHKSLNNNQLILEGLIRAMPQLTERNQLM